MSISPNRQTDQLIWIDTSTEKFYVKSAYHMKRKIDLRRPWVKAHVPPRIVMCGRGFEI